MKYSIIIVITLIIMSGCSTSDESNDLFNQITEENSILEDLLEESYITINKLDDQLVTIQNAYDTLALEKEEYKSYAEEMKDKYTLDEAEYNELLDSHELESSEDFNSLTCNNLVEYYRNELIMLNQIENEQDFEMNFSIGNSLSVLSKIEDNYSFIDVFNEFQGRTETTVEGASFELLFDPTKLVRIRIMANEHCGSLPIIIGNDYDEALKICDENFEKMYDPQNVPIDHWFLLDNGNYLILYSDTELTASNQVSGPDKKLVMVEIGSPTIYD